MLTRIVRVCGKITASKLSLTTFGNSFGEACLGKSIKSAAAISCKSPYLIQGASRAASVRRREERCFSSRQEDDDEDEKLKENLLIPRNSVTRERYININEVKKNKKSSGATEEVKGRKLSGHDGEVRAEGGSPNEEPPVSKAEARTFKPGKVPKPRGGREGAKGDATEAMSETSGEDEDASEPPVSKTETKTFHPPERPEPEVQPDEPPPQQKADNMTRSRPDSPEKPKEQAGSKTEASVPNPSPHVEDLSTTNARVITIDERVEVEVEPEVKKKVRPRPDTPGSQQEITARPRPDTPSEGKEDK